MHEVLGVWNCLSATAGGGLQWLRAADVHEELARAVAGHAGMEGAPTLPALLITCRCPPNTDPPQAWSSWQA